jgi:hypothetical protein
LLYFNNLQLRERDEKLGEAGELQRFLGNLDHFQQWLSRTQTTVASEDIPNSLADAEKLLNQHQQLKDEIDAYAPEYAKMKEFGDKVTEGQEDPQYMFLRQVREMGEKRGGGGKMYYFSVPALTHMQSIIENKYFFCILKCIYCKLPSVYILCQIDSN